MKPEEDEPYHHQGIDEVSDLDLVNKHSEIDDLVAVNTVGEKYCMNEEKDEVPEQIEGKNC